MKTTTITIIAVVLSIVAVIGGLILNFPQFLYGDNANTKNLIVTILYLAIWLFVLFSAYKSKSRGVLIYFLVFWLSIIVVSAITMFAQITEWNFDWFIPFILLIVPFYGIEFFTNNYVFSSIVIAAISSGMSIAAILLLRRSGSAVKK